MMTFFFYVTALPPVTVNSFSLISQLFPLTTFLFKGCCVLLGSMSEEKVEKKKEIKKDEFGDVVEEKEEVKAEKD
jgi:hypothetical protein